MPFGQRPNKFNSSTAAMSFGTLKLVNNAFAGQAKHAKFDVIFKVAYLVNCSSD